MINIRFYKCSHYIPLTKRYQSIYYISSHFLSTILKTGHPDRNRQVTQKHCQYNSSPITSVCDSAHLGCFMLSLKTLQFAIDIPANHP